MSRADGRRFGLTLGAAFVVLSAATWWRGRAAIAVAALSLGGALLLMAVVLPSRLGPVQRVWLAFGAALSRVTTPIFLGATYFGAIAPTGLLLRAFGRNPLTRQRGRDTCWISRPDDARSRNDMERQF